MSPRTVKVKVPERATVPTVKAPDNRNPLRRPDQCSDEQLIKALRSAHEQLAARYSPLVYKLVVAHELPEPVLQAIFEVANDALGESVATYDPLTGPFADHVEALVSFVVEECVKRATIAAKEAEREEKAKPSKLIVPTLRPVPAATKTGRSRTPA